MKSIDKLRELLSREIGEAEPYFKGVAICDEIEAEIERDYMKLPVDANGVPIHIGDEMFGDCPSGKHVSGCVTFIGENRFMLGNPQFYLRGDYMPHVKPDPLKELLDDVSKGITCYPRERVTGYLEDNLSIGEAVMLDVRDRLRELLGGDAESRRKEGGDD